MKKHKKQSQSRPVLILLVALLGIGLCIAMLLQGLDVALLNPKGYIATEQTKLMLFSAAVLLGVAVPTIGILYFFAWKYRESNATATYHAEANHGKRFILLAWGIPVAVLLVLAPVMWASTHKLEPQKQIAANAKPMTVQVIAMRWKWLFIYPEQNIATVNFLQIPKDTPVTFVLTADEAPMNSFWIPHLGGQLYAMTGHVNPLNLIAGELGDYPGSAAEISGHGFAGMKFTTRVSTQDDFDTWVKDTQQVPGQLDSSAYAELLKPSENNKPVYYSTADADLYDKVLMKYNSGGHSSGGHGAGH